MTHSRSPLENLPTDVLHEIEKYLSDSDKGRLAETSQTFYFHHLNFSTHTHTFYHPHIRIKCEKIHQLLLHIVYGEQNEAKLLLKNDPGLLLEKGTIKDHSGRKIQGTPLQIASGAEDFSINKKQEGMVEMILRYFNMLPHGTFEISAQLKEQFPDGHEEKEIESAKQDLEALKKVINAISASHTNRDCETAFNEFENYLKPKNLIKMGKHFNSQLLVEAFKSYNNNYHLFGGWDSYKNNLLWCRVIGHLQRFLPACYAQAFCNGIYNLVEAEKPFDRRLKLDNGITYFPLDRNPAYRLGIDFGVYGCASVACSRGAAPISGKSFEKLCSAKKNSLKKLMSKYHPAENQRPCMVM